MARPVGSKNRPKAPPANGGIGHNSGEMDDEQCHALTVQHRAKYETALAAKKAADADLKNVCKRARADLGAGAIDDIKDLISLDAEGSETGFQAELKRRIRVARWAGVELGFEPDLFLSGDRSLRERAFDEGKRAGMVGEPGKPPSNYSPGSDGEQGWMEGWHRGQELFAQQSFKKPAVSDAGLITAEKNKPTKPDAFDEGGDKPEWPDEAQAKANKKPAAEAETPAGVH